MIGTPKTGKLNVALSRSLAQEYLTAKESVVLARTAMRNGTGELETANTTVQNRKLVTASGLVHSSMFHAGIYSYIIRNLALCFIGSKFLSYIHLNCYSTSPFPCHKKIILGKMEQKFGCLEQNFILDREEEK